MRARAAAARAVWLGYWNLMRRYHRYEVRGLERLVAPGSALIVGYHGRPFAFDLCMLQALLLERTGSMPRAVMHATAAHVPLLDWMVEGMEFVLGDAPALAAAAAQGDKIIVTPGGTREGCRAHHDRYRVEWGERTGYLRLALKYGLPILPAASSGIDDTYFGLNDGYAWGKRLHVPGGMPAWIGIGPLGLWPLSPPFPVKIVQHIGEPLDLLDDGPVDPRDRDQLLALHRRVTGAVQALLDRATEEAAR